MIKIEERTINGKTELRYASKSNASNLSNTRELNGKIIQRDGLYFLESDDGLIVEVEKRPDGFYTQSYSCLSSATHVLEKFFNINLNYQDFPQGLLQHLPEELQKAVLSGKSNGDKSPEIVIKYFSEN